MAQEIEIRVDEICKLASSEVSAMNKLMIIKNLIVLSLGFVFLFSAFIGLTNLQSIRNGVGNIGMMSHGVIYGSLIISCLFLPKLIIKRIGYKIAIAVSMLMYAPYIASNFYPKLWTLMPSAVLLGIGVAILWPSACTYINELGYMDAGEDAKMAELSTAKFFGIFLMFFQSAQIWGNLVSFLVLQPSGYSFTTPLNASLTGNGTGQTLSCGANFCTGVNNKMQPPPEEKKYILVGVCLTFSLVAVAIIALLLDPLTRMPKEEKNDDSVLLKLVATFRNLTKVDQLLLLGLTMFCGLEQGFMSGDFTRAYIACAWGLQYIGLVIVYYGVFNAIGCFSVGYIVKYLPRMALMTFAVTTYFGVCLMLLVRIPSGDSPEILFTVVGFWAYGDAIWQTLLNVLYGILFREDAEAAFANYRLWESMGFMIAFRCSGIFCTSLKIYMQIAFLTIGFLGYVAVECRIWRKKKSYLIPKLY